MGLPHTFIQGSKDFLEYINNLETSQSFYYHQNIQQPLKSFNYYHLVNDEFGFKGLNLVHKNYFQTVDKKITCVLTKNNNSIGPFCVIEPDSTFKGNVTLEESVIMKGVHLGENVSILKSILAEGVVVGKNAKISDLSVIGEKFEIKEGEIVTQQKLPKKM